MFTVTELWLSIVLVGMLTLPGWAVLTVNDYWRQWRGLQRWVVAVGISVAFYPAFFYALRSVLPFLTLGPYKMTALLLAFAAVIGWRMRGHWKEQFSFDRLEWVALGIFGMTVFTRFWIIRDQPYPAWADSLHHTLLTELTAVQGRLPFDMEPYFPIPLGQYHLGLYALSATVEWLGQAPAHTALLWVSQALNSLCVAGIYLVLDRKVGRMGALVGAAIAGLLSHQPAFYVNWGRFTQIASQTILLIAWLVTWEAITWWKRPWQEYKATVLWNTVCAALLTGAVFLLHFRVAAFYIPLLAITVVWELWKAHTDRQIGPVLLGTLAIAIAALVVVAPALGKFLTLYVARVSNFERLGQTVVAASEVSQTIEQYYRSSLRAVSSLVARSWLIVLACAGAVIGLLKRNKLVLACLVWASLLYAMGQAYLVGLYVTNLGAVLIMFYLPVALIVGSAAEEVIALAGPRWRERIVRLITALVLIASFIASHVRVTEVKPYRYFVTPKDVTAMNWIRKNTPPDALFAVNTHFWLPYAPHGTDAGYWIPYLTGRQTTAATMIFDQGVEEYVFSVVEMSRVVELLEIDNTALAELQARGVDYIYIGQRGDFSGPGLDATRLNQADNVTLVYQDGRVSILRVQPADHSPDATLE